MTIFSVEITIKKNGRREKIFQNKCVLVPKIAVIRKEVGATVAASHLPSPWQKQCGQSRLSGRTGSVLPWKPSNLQRESPINYHKCPNYETPAFSVSTELTNEHSFERNFIKTDEQTN